MISPSSRAIKNHLEQLSACTICPRMHRPSVVGRPVINQVILIGQAPGDKEPKLGRPFAWTAGKTLFKWFQDALGWTEEETRDRIYFAAVCRCFPGKKETGGDRVPDRDEIANCRRWLTREFALLQPRLILPVGKLAIAQFLPIAGLETIIGRSFVVNHQGHQADCIPLPHPSGASPWHRIEPGRSLLLRAFRQIALHPAIRDAAIARK